MIFSLTKIIKWLRVNSFVQSLYLFFNSDSLYVRGNTRIQVLYNLFIHQGSTWLPITSDNSESIYPIIRKLNFSWGEEMLKREKMEKEKFNRAKVTSNSSTIITQYCGWGSVLTELLTNTGMSLGLWWNFIVPVGPLLLKMRALSMPKGTLDRSMQQTELLISAWETFVSAQLLPTHRWQQQWQHSGVPVKGSTWGMLGFSCSWCSNTSWILHTENRLLLQQQQLDSNDSFEWADSHKLQLQLLQWRGGEKEMPATEDERCSKP